MKSMMRLLAILMAVAMPLMVCGFAEEEFRGKERLRSIDTVAVTMDNFQTVILNALNSEPCYEINGLDNYMPF